MALPISKEYLLTQLRNFKSIVLDPAYIIQKETLPLATAQNLGTIFQYIGNDAVNYTIGGFYQVQVVPETEPAEYAWVEVSTKTLIDNTTIQRNANKELYVPKATSSALGVVKAGDGTSVDSNGVISVVARLEEIDELPTATAALEGKIYLLTATQTGYDRGGIYMCEESTETAGTYEWKLISMSPLEAGKGITIENDVISADTNVFNGTLDEWGALTSDEQAQYSHIATPEEADITGSYSTTETKTGATWIDGKPIYRRVFYSATNWASSTVVGTISNLGMVIGIRDICTANGAYMQNYGADAAGTTQRAVVDMTTGAVTVYRGVGFVNNNPSTVIIEYTKAD